jgi:hypothetical protein
MGLMSANGLLGNTAHRRQKRECSGTHRMLPGAPGTAAAKPSIAGKSLIGLAAGCLYHATPRQPGRFGKWADFFP